MARPRGFEPLTFAFGVLRSSVLGLFFDISSLSQCENRSQTRWVTRTKRGRSQKTALRERFRCTFEKIGGMVAIDAFKRLAAHPQEARRFPHRNAPLHEPSCARMA